MPISAAQQTATAIFAAVAPAIARAAASSGAAAAGGGRAAATAEAEEHAELAERAARGQRREPAPHAAQLAAVGLAAAHSQQWRRARPLIRTLRSARASSSSRISAHGVVARDGDVDQTGASAQQQGLDGRDRDAERARRAPRS